MKFRDAKDTILQLINMYSERGEVISGDNRNIADFGIKAKNYINIALRTVSNTYPIQKVTEDIVITNNQNKHKLPSGLIRIIRIYKNDDYDWFEFTNYYLIDDSHIIFNECGTYRIRYDSLSTLIETESTNIELDIPVALENAVCYYAAAMMIQSERPDVASRLFEQYTELMYRYEPNSKKMQRKIKRL